MATRPSRPAARSAPSSPSGPSGPSGHSAGNPLAAPAQPGDLLLYRLVKLAAASGRLVTRLCERSHGITRREWGVVMWLAQEPGLQPSVLAVRLELDRARVSRAIGSLEGKGLVQRRPPADGRPAGLHLTEGGTRLHAALWPEVRAINQALALSLDAAHLDALDRSLAQLQDRAAQLERQPAGAAPFPPRNGGARAGGRRGTAPGGGPAA